MLSRYTCQINRLSVLLPLFVLLLLSAAPLSQAALPKCHQNNPIGDKRICRHPELNNLNQQLQQTYLNARLMSNAPQAVLIASQTGWEQFVQQCRTTRCIKRHFEQRINDLVMMTQLNQSLTQHFIAIHRHQMAKPFTTLQLQQLDKRKIKIEGLRYNDPNLTSTTYAKSGVKKRSIDYLRAYTTMDQMTQVIDLESKCRFKLNRTRYGLTFSSQDPQCQMFVGHYRLYD